MKKITIFLALLIMLVTVLNFLAVNVDAYDYGDQISTIDGIKDSSKASTSTQNVVGAILQVARMAAVGVALIMLTVLAMKYMYSAPGDRAEIKNNKRERVKSLSRNSLYVNYAALTSAAIGSFLPSVISKVTVCPSSKVLNPSPTIPVKCTK